MIIFPLPFKSAKLFFEQSGSLVQFKYDAYSVAVSAA